MKLSTTKKKFYNKWLFRCSYFFKVKDLRQKLLGKSTKNQSINDIVNFLSTLDKNQYFIRVEKYTLDLYFNEQEIFDRLKDISPDNLFRSSIPNEESTELLEKNKVILCKHLPYHKYRFKMYLQPHKNQDRDLKKKYIEWLETQQQRIYISERTKHWFIITSYNYDRRYMYVEDEQTLLLLKMKNPDILGMVYQYQVHDK